METNEIKKLLYRGKPTAHFNRIKDGVAKYSCLIEGEDGNQIIVFLIPVTDMGDAEFGREVPAQLLIRWMI